MGVGGGGGGGGGGGETTHSLTNCLFSHLSVYTEKLQHICPQ